MRRARQNDDLRDKYVSYGEVHLAEWTYKELSIFTFDLTVFLRNGRLFIITDSNSDRLHLFYFFKLMNNNTQNGNINS